MVKKLLAMGCIAAMLLAPVRAQVFEVYSGEKVLQLCAPMDHISRPVCKTYFQGLAEATQEAEQMDICLPNLPIQAMINTTYDELKTVSPQVSEPFTEVRNELAPPKMMSVPASATVGP